MNFKNLKKGDQIIFKSLRGEIRSGICIEDCNKFNGKYFKENETTKPICNGICKECLKRMENPDVFVLDDVYCSRCYKYLFLK